jgi:hypothetical protein
MTRRAKIQKIEMQNSYREQERGPAKTGLTGSMMLVGGGPVRACRPSAYPFASLFKLVGEATASPPEFSMITIGANMGTYEISLKAFMPAPVLHAQYPSSTAPDRLRRELVCPTVEESSSEHEVVGAGHAAQWTWPGISSAWVRSRTHCLHDDQGGNGHEGQFERTGEPQQQALLPGPSGARFASPASLTTIGSPSRKSL